MELGPNELRVLGLNRRMVMALATPEEQAFWRGVFAAADEHQRHQAAMERRARPVDVGALEINGRYEVMVRGNRGVRA